MGRNNHYRYFRVMQGLRGCYMPDTNDVIRVSSRRELRSYLADEAHYIVENSGIGLSKRNISWAANHAWKRNTKGAILPWGYRGTFDPPHHAIKPYSIEVSPATRGDYISHQED